MKKAFATVAIVCFALFSQSCKKDNDSDPVSTPPEKVCRTTAVTVESSSESPFTYSFSYNNDNKVSKIVTSREPQDVTTFTYSGNTVNVISQSGDYIFDKEILTVNDAGLLLRSETYDPVNDTLISYLEYEYSANGEISKATQVYGNDEPFISSCSYSDGNLVSIFGGGSVAVLEYYNDEKYRIGDYLQLLQLTTFGSARYIVNKNLIKSQKLGSNISNFNYTFDADNNISQLDVIEGTDITTYYFQQVCK